ncbi:hypothetical protein LRP30_36870 [Bradyrhizobium sp. C-145]|uniref:hypothetical protein n=1 Tax=Bradyrhizobium sp. C-145 TaxID=574727 RepID=UPI00201B55AD|nr:hypothetical protein [Bradyrhizobium sp. C-145]UQR62290.1 hypothetical protein LRP30_36870 [Bradyrhizobium sp. C-145]
MMALDGKLARLRTYRNNIHRYHRLLKTRLSDLEREYIESRLSEEREALVRGEASRTAQGANVSWWTDRAEIGTRFCFEDSKSKELFALTCDRLGITCQDG